ncbi:hypothetical protein BHE90_017188 [Fusarium euwallaceae]|uniref:Zn(2)-C6 fungal-type domain-containing protein n=1 Tax=Fusarium euwallaceae TaxID=1147111 RepID=A0A430KYE8_9HYPO|nr:hypothetical protein BHE90_017188 [Fusarium euwallaceae]
MASRTSDNAVVPNPGTPKSLSCLKCKQSKQKCDKSLPQCLRCAEKGKECIYPSARQTNTVKRKQVRDLEAILERVEQQIGSLGAGESMHSHSERAAPELQGRQAEADSTDSLNNHLLLASPLLSGDISQPIPPIDPHLREELTTMYFDKLYHAAPMIHRRRYMASLGHPLSHQPPYCLQLIIMASAAYITDDYTSMAPTLYQRAKDLAEEDEIHEQEHNFLTLAHTQCWILISNFEARLAMFSQASISLGKAIRTAQMLNLHQLDRNEPASYSRSPSSPASTKDWSELEECRRTWWIAFTSDRLVFSTSGLPVLIHERDIQTLLPTSEDAFTSGIEEETKTFQDALRQPGPGCSPLAFRALAAHLFYLSLKTMPSAHGEGDAEENQDSWLNQYDEIDSRLALLLTQLPERLRLPQASRCQQAVFVNILIHEASICLHKSILERAQHTRGLIPEPVIRRSQSRMMTAAEEILSIFRLRLDLKIALRNPILNFAAYTAGLVFLERAADGQSAESQRNVNFIINVLDGISHTHPAARELAAQLAANARAAGIERSMGVN